MSDKFVNSLKKENNFKTTENDAVALKSTTSSLVDLFGQIGAMRKRGDNDIIAAFTKAMSEDKLLATKMAFYARDIRFGGLGERRAFRVILKYMASYPEYAEIVKKNIENIAYFGRYDDLFELVGTPLEDNMLDYISFMFWKDKTSMDANMPISLLSKWLKSSNTSSKRSCELGKLTANKLSLSVKQYRKTLSALRGYIKVVEKKMTHGEWTEINYEQVPSKAMSNYRKAFQKHDNDGFASYIESVTKGEKKINASTLFPYDIMEKMGLYSEFQYGKSWKDTYQYFTFKNYDKVLEEQWNALPNYVDGENNVLVMADTSGSMEGRPIATSIGLSLYFAERNKGAFHNLFMTFSEEPNLVELKGNTLFEKVKCIPAIIANTDLEKTFDLILQTAINGNISQEELPKSLVIISDMEFDEASDVNRHNTFYESMRNKFAQHNYEIPNIIFWQVDARHDTFHVTSDYIGVQLASGQSASTFKTILKNIGLNPYEAMVNTLNNPVYDRIVV